jgi:hypothetical protein
MREKTERQDDGPGAGNVDERCGRRFYGADVDIEGGHPRRRDRSKRGDTRKKKKKDEHTLNAILPTTSRSANLL